MKYAIYAPIFNDYGDPARLVELAQESEAAGFDGFFIWDHLAFEPGGRLHVVDATVTLGAIAQATRSIRLGAMVTPLARRRPWKLARELVTLDHLSGGRVTLGVGLGEPADLEFAAFGEDADARARAARLDEGLAIFDKLVRGETLEHDGRYYTISNTRFAPAARQRPRMPIWVAATLPARAGLRRAACWDGVVPVRAPAASEREPNAATDWSQWWLSAEEFGELVSYVEQRRKPGRSFDYVASGRLGASAEAGQGCSAYARRGATWWFGWVEEAPGTYAATLAAVRRGPPAK